MAIALRMDSSQIANDLECAQFDLVECKRMRLDQSTWQRFHPRTCVVLALAHHS